MPLGNTDANNTPDWSENVGSLALRTKKKEILIFINFMCVMFSTI